MTERSYHVSSPQIPLHKQNDLMIQASRKPKHIFQRVGSKVLVLLRLRPIFEFPLVQITMTHQMTVERFMSHQILTAHWKPLQPSYDIVYPSILQIFAAL